MWTPAYQTVTCKTCKTAYTCTPTADYYNSTCDTDGVCERCLLKNAGMADAPMHTLTWFLTDTPKGEG